jgi:cbb3-type cytochrome oxidase maturation protein
MTIIILLIFISLIIAVGFLIAFLWNMKSGQYDDTYSPSVRMLFEDKVSGTDEATKTQGHKAITKSPTTDNL